jgi:hypothetical protein
LRGGNLKLGHSVNNNGPTTFHGIFHARNGAHFRNSEPLPT